LPTCGGPVQRSGEREIALRLTPQKREFFVLFTQASANARDIARALVELLDEWPDNREKLRDIRELEHEGDRLTHAVCSKRSSRSSPSGGSDAVRRVLPRRRRRLHDLLFI
jgi:hypothetical protein